MVHDAYAAVFIGLWSLGLLWCGERGKPAHHKALTCPNELTCSKALTWPKERTCHKGLISHNNPSDSVEAQTQYLRPIKRVRQVMPLHPKCVLQALRRQHLQRCAQ
ncbi:hypothetical protein PS687_03497 [Pseudomonas fluorescens]|nr:hypothetical protein PS687_03497 [Pseudomonas fluorescens]